MEHKKQNTVCLYQCSLFSYCCSVFLITVPFFHKEQWNQNGTVFLYNCSVFLYHRSVFLYHCSVLGHCCSVFSYETMEQKRNSVFLYHCSFFCTTVPFLYNVPFLHRFCHSKTEQKWNSVYFVPLFLVFVPLFRFGALLFSFFFHTKQRNKDATVFFPLFSVFLPLFRFLFFFLHKEQRNNVFLHYRSVFSLRNKGTVWFCTTVPFFNGTTEQKRNSVFLYHCSVFALLFRFCITIPFCTTLPFFP